MTTSIPLISRLSARIIRVLGCNPGPMTLQGTNTYIIGTGRKRLLLDAGDSDVKEYTTALASLLKEEQCTLEGILITHWHHDHIGGVADVLGLPYVSSQCSVWKLPRLEEKEEHNGFKVEPLKDGQTINVDGATIRVIATPGHTTDHAAVWLVEEDAVFAGDCVLGEGTTVFEHLPSYLRSLRSLAELQPKILYPGHGPIVEKPLEKIEEYIHHRMERERQVISALAELTKAKSQQLISEMDIVDLIYQGLPSHLKLAAASNVNHHLVKLLEEKKVLQLQDGTWQLNNSNKL